MTLILTILALVFIVVNLFLLFQPPDWLVGFIIVPAAVFGLHFVPSPWLTGLAAAGALNVVLNFLGPVQRTSKQPTKVSRIPEPPRRSRG